MTSISLQTAELLPLPSKEVRQEIGQAAIRFGQLEHPLKVIYKRSDKNISLGVGLERLNGCTLGALLVELKGLINLAKGNPPLASVKDQLSRVRDLSKPRKRYLHDGTGRNSSGEFFFLHTGEQIEESKMFAELVAASTSAESLLSELNTKLPASKMED